MISFFCSIFFAQKKCFLKLKSTNNVIKFKIAVELFQERFENFSFHCDKKTSFKKTQL